MSPALAPRPRPRLAMVLVAALAVTACGSDKREQDSDLLPPPGFVVPPIRIPGRAMKPSNVVYSHGFHWHEADARGNTWRWMGASGEAQLYAGPGDHTLTITGWIPLELMPGRTPRLRLLLDGKELDVFAVEHRDINKQYRIDSTRLPVGRRSTLKLETSELFHAPDDSRPLGLAVSRIEWQPGQNP